jgi:hypothetical protein
MKILLIFNEKIYHISTVHQWPNSISRPIEFLSGESKILFLNFYGIIYSITPALRIASVY